MNKLDEKDIELFRAAVGEVKPIVDDRVTVPKPTVKAVPAQLKLDEQQVMQVLATGDIDPESYTLGDEIQYQRPGVHRNVMRKLRRGQYSVGDELDLHGMVSTEAKQLLAEFIKEVWDKGIRCVRVIHGKGLRSSNNGPVLKPLTAKWLARNDTVLAFCTARPVDGGTGALYVLLKK